jgi:transcriptional regulator with XRE-family HTH domain
MATFAHGCAKLAYMEYEAIAADLLRALRGRRSQTAFSRRLGYRSNVVYRWESGRAWPTAAATLRAAGKVGVDLRAGLRSFFRSEPTFMAETDPATPQGVARLLAHLRGSTPIGELARRCGRSRFAVARWLKGEAEPRLPELLLLVEAASQRLLDFLTILVDPMKLPSTARAYEELRAARESAYTMPWSHAVLRVLALEEYAALPRHEPGFVAHRLGISQEEEDRCLELLARSRQIRKRHNRWVPDLPRVVDTRADPERHRRLVDWWTRLALERVGAGHGLVSSYAIFTVSSADVLRIREAYSAFYRQMRAIVAESEPNQEVLVWAVQMVPLQQLPSEDAARAR